MQGWLLDLYEDAQDGVVLWFLGDDGSRQRLRQEFPVTFYAAGSSAKLRALWQFLDSQPVESKLERTERRDLFSEELVTVLACEVKNPALQEQLFRDASRAFPDLTYYNADLPLPLRYAARYGTFPLARCEFEADAKRRLEEIEVMEEPWDLEPEPVPLRVFSIEPDTSPSHAPPKYLAIRIKGEDQLALPNLIDCRLPLENERPLLINLRSLLQRHDPDLLLTSYGDTWILPHLLELSKRWNIPLPLNRDPGRGAAYRPEKSYFTYGQVVHRGQQYHLFGRWHIDRCNAMLYHDYGMEGVMELARVTSLSMQTVARVSPGTGISAMQILTALREGVLVPWHKQQAERPKSVLDLLRSDQGGLVYQPITGLHANVAEVDFISMYPSIMARFNVSPETVGIPPVDLAEVDEPPRDLGSCKHVPQTGLPIDQEQKGLIPLTLEPLLKKRLDIKLRLAELPAWDPRRTAYKARTSAHKWLLVTCFGYLGYKNARFGRIEAHEAVTAYGREALLRAKEAAEDMDGTVIHLYVDGMWVKKEGMKTPADFQPLLDEIAAATGLPIALDGVYKWVAFLPSRMDERVPVANRYFGAFQDGSLKMRGIETRRTDTPPFIARMQVELLERMAKVESAEELPGLLPELYALVRRKIAALRRGQIKPADLLVNQKVSRNLDEYRTLPPAARAALQLLDVKKQTRAGQRVRFIHTLGEPSVFAWDLPGPFDMRTVDVPRYIDLLLRAASTIFQPLGVPEEKMRSIVLYRAYYEGVSIQVNKYTGRQVSGDRGLVTRNMYTSSQINRYASDRGAVTGLIFGDTTQDLSLFDQVPD